MAGRWCSGDWRDVAVRRKLGLVGRYVPCGLIRLAGRDLSSASIPMANLRPAGLRLWNCGRRGAAGKPLCASLGGGAQYALFALSFARDPAGPTRPMAD